MAEPTEKPVAEKVAQPKSVASGVLVNLFGVLTIPVDFMPVVRAEKASETSLSCTECKTPTKVGQQYVCPIDPDHGPFTVSTAGRVKEINGTLHHVTAEQIKEMKQPTLPPGSLDLQVFSAAEIEAQTRPSGTVYRLVPKVASSLPMYAAIRDMLGDRSLAFVGETTVKGVQRFYRLDVWAGHLVVQELTRPETVVPAEPVQATYEGKLLATITALAEAQTSTFDATAFRSGVTERAKALEAEIAAAAGAPAPKGKKRAAPADTDASLLANLEAALAAAKAAKTVK